MAQPLVSLFIDVQNRQLVRTATSTIPALLPIAYQGDTLNLTLRFLQAPAPYTDIDYSSAAVTVSVGANEAKPTAGTFTITDTVASQTTVALPYNATAAQLQTAIQTALTTHWPAATVYGGTGGPYYITNGSNGIQTALIGTALTLEPASSVVITPLQAGDTNLPAIQYVQLSVNPIALQDSWTPSTDPDLLTGTLSLATASIEALMGTNPSICGVFSIKVTPVGQDSFTAVQMPFLIQNDNILGAPSVPTPSVRYYTTLESDARYAMSTGTGIYIERDSSGATDQHITTSGANNSNILYLMTNAPSTVIFTFDNGTFDGQTITYRTDASISSITYSGNVAGVLSPDSIYGAGAILSFMWDASNTVWFPI